MLPCGSYSYSPIALLPHDVTHSSMPMRSVTYPPQLHAVPALYSVSGRIGDLIPASSQPQSRQGKRVPLHRRHDIQGQTKWTGSRIEILTRKWVGECGGFRQHGDGLAECRSALGFTNKNSKSVEQSSPQLHTAPALCSASGLIGDLIPPSSKPYARQGPTSAFCTVGTTSRSD